MDADRIVKDFCETWESLDVDRIVGFFTDDAIYHNIPMAPCKGKDEIRTFIQGFLATTKSIRFEILNQVASGPVVMNERVDTIQMEAGTISAPVMGVFELTADGKISGWRDYFDMGAFTPK